MRTRILIVGLILGSGLAGPSPAAERSTNFWIMPTAGVSGNGSFRISSEEVAYTSVRVGGGFAYGLAFGTRLSSGLALEVVWSRNNVDATGTAPGDEDTPAVSQALFQGIEDQLQATILLGTGYAVGPFDPYFLFGAGVTTLDPDTDLPGVSRFAWSAGFGLEASFKGPFGFRVQGRFVPSFVRTADALWQGGTGIDDVRSQMTQWEFLAGLVFRF